MKSGPLVISLLQKLEDRGIPIVYLRNYDGLPADIGNDVDLLVPKGMRRSAALIIEQSLTGTGWKLFRKIEFGPLSVFLAKEDGSCLIHLDLFDRIEWYWLEYADTNAILKRRQWNGTVHHPAPADEVFLNVMTRLVYAGIIRDKHRTQVQKFQRNDDSGWLTTTFAEHLGPELGSRLAQQIAARDWNWIQTEVSRLRQTLLRNAITRRTSRTISSLFRYTRRGVSRIIRPPGPFIVFEGADGVGKSTVMEEIAPFLKEVTGRTDTMIFHWKPTQASIRLVGDPTGTPQNPRKTSPRSMLVSLVFLTYHWLGFWAGYLRFVLPARAKNRAVIGDRYAYEFFLDPERLRLRLPFWILRLAAHTVPQPGFVVCMVAKTSTVVARKQELSKEEIHQYQTALENEATRNYQYILVDANGPIEDVVASIRARLFSRLLQSAP